MRRLPLRPFRSLRSSILPGILSITVVSLGLIIVLGFPAADAAPNAPNDSLFLADGYLVDPLVGAARPAHVMIVDGVVADFPDFLPASFAGHLVDVSGRFIAPRFLDLRLRASSDASPQSPFETLVAGPILTTDGGHGADRAGQSIRLDSPADARRRVAGLIDAEAPLVHVAYGSASREADSTHRGIDRATLDAVIDAAKREELPVLVHVDSWAAVREAMQAGADGFVHLPAEPLPDDLAPWLAQRKAVCVPTLTDANLHVATRHTDGIDEATARANRRDALRRLERAGVRIVAGTELSGDASWLHDELEAMVDAGVSASSAVRSVTLGARRFLDRPWSFSTGTPSHFLIFENSPYNDIRHTRSLTAIVRDGSWIETAEIETAELQPESQTEPAESKL